MTTNEIKKALYKQKPVAHLDLHNETEVKYYTELEDGTKVNFTIPIEEAEPLALEMEHNDVAIKTYKKKEWSQLLIRWIDND